MIGKREVQATVKGVLFAGALLVLVTLPYASAALQETRTFTSDRLEVRNLIGEVRVESHRGADFEVEVTVKGADARDGMIELDASDEVFNIRFPEASEFVYPALGRSSTRLGSRDSEWLSQVGAGRRVSVKGSGRGLELWTDVVIRTPPGHELKVRHAVGRLIAENVDADLELSTHSGDVSVRSVRGRLEVATGSGDVTAERVEGESTEIATGSGDIEAGDITADRIAIATGSGDVSVSVVDGRRLQVATGSGDVKAREVSADSAKFATGSGKVVVALSRTGDGEYNFGTGSGDIVLTLPLDASVELHAETDRGEIEVALDGEARYAVREDDEVRLTVGRGDARVRLGPGSGDIRIRN